LLRLSGNGFLRRHHACRRRIDTRRAGEEHPVARRFPDAPRPSCRGTAAVRPFPVTDTRDGAPWARAGLDTVVVPAGTAWVGSDRPFEGPPVQVDVPAFRISRLAVTNAQSSRFLVEGGYRRPEFWNREGLAWKAVQDLDRPAYWHDQRFNQPA